MHTADTALAFATRVHEHQIDDDGESHARHVERVVANARRLIAALPPGLVDPDEADEILQAAALHDVPEDEEFTGVGHADLEREGFAPGVRSRVRRLDKRFKVGSYQENIEAMCAEGDIGVVIAKLADNLDNGDPARLARLPPEKRSIGRRYARARESLQAAYDAFAASAPSPGPAA